MSESKNLHPQGHFWSGFYLGAIFGVGGLYLFGTKKGRETMQNILDATENLENSAIEILEEFQADLTRAKIASPTVEMITSHIPSEEKLNDVATRIKHIFSPKSEIKKDGKKKKRT